MARRQVETAEQIVAALGTMKGAAMKLGQVMSFLDVGLVPEEFREEFQAELAKLRDAAPKVSFKDMKKVIEEEYGEQLDDVFESFDPVPIAAASIGQVYRARYEGATSRSRSSTRASPRAVRSDMQNLGMILRLMKSHRARASTRRRSATRSARASRRSSTTSSRPQNQRTLARIYSGHPFIVIPDVVTPLSRERVIVSEFVDGPRLRGVQELPEDERDRIGEIDLPLLLRVRCTATTSSRGDPHPGNCLLLDDGRMAFLDFGLFKRISARRRRVRAADPAAGHRGRGRRAHRAPARAAAASASPSTTTRRRSSSSSTTSTGWYTLDEEIDARRPRSPPR